MQTVENMIVLILVLMEDALALAKTISWWSVKRPVLILVLMEDALARNKTFQ